MAHSKFSVIGPHVIHVYKTQFGFIFEQRTFGEQYFCIKLFNVYFLLYVCQNKNVRGNITAFQNPLLPRDSLKCSIFFAQTKNPFECYRLASSHVMILQAPKFLILNFTLNQRYIPSLTFLLNLQHIYLDFSQYKGTGRDSDSKDGFYMYVPQFLYIISFQLATN